MGRIRIPAGSHHTQQASYLKQEIDVNVKPYYGDRKSLTLRLSVDTTISGLLLEVLKSLKEGQGETEVNELLIPSVVYPMVECY